MSLGWFMVDGFLSDRQARYRPGQMPGLYYMVFRPLRSLGSRDGGRFLTLSTSQVQPHQAGLQQRTVIVEFDGYDIALAAHESEAYQKALQALGSGAERDFRIFEGI